MEFNMIENGMDSFRFSVDQYKKFIDLDNKYEPEAGTHLKATVIFLQHTLEIFNKLILCKHNDLLIFDISKPSDILKVIKEKEKLGLKGSLHQFVSLVQGSGVKTIGYEESVNRIEFLYDLKDSHVVETMRAINKIRNSITHFAYVSGMRFYKVMLDIDNAYRVINEFYKHHLDLDSYFFNGFYDLKEFTIDLLEITQFIINDHWESFYDEVLEEIEEVFNLLKNDPNFQEECHKRNVNLTIQSPKYLISRYFDIEITRLDDGELIDNIGTLLIPSLDTVALFDEGNNSVRTLMRFGNVGELPELVFSKTPLEIDLDTLRFSYKYKENKKAYKTPFELESLKRVLLMNIDAIVGSK